MLDKDAPRPPVPYFLLILLALMLLNSILVPAFTREQVREVDYNTFLTQLDEGKIAEVRLQNERLFYSTLDTENQDTHYVTGAWQDSELVEKLHGKKVSFTRVVPHETSPIVNFLLAWVLPVFVFILLGQLLMRKMGGALGGRNALTLGKSNAKIYAESETGKTFADVAGQDEAKEALTEIVDFLHSPEKYTAIGATLPKGALLVGPPGTGKKSPSPASSRTKRRR